MKHAREMTDVGFAAAMKARAWRQVQQPKKPDDNDKPKNATAMTEAEFEAALAARAWRR